jgi:hypothetical protein
MSQVTHGSADPSEITYILGGDNVQAFEDLGVKVERTAINEVVFTAKNAKTLGRAEPKLKEILDRYRKPVRRSVVISKDMVACFRGAKSVHLNAVKSKTGVLNVYFNNKTSENGVEMVEVAVVGIKPCVDHFMFELLKSVSFFLQREAKFKMPPRPPRKEFKKEENEDEDDEDDDDEDE